MFVDASAVIAIIAGEDDASSIAGRLSRANVVCVSPIVISEATTGLARRRACPIEEAEALVDASIKETKGVCLQIDDPLGKAAIAAFRRYGKGRHKADLNMGDCFSYACAIHLKAPLLFKGNDFIHTDVPAA